MPPAPVPMKRSTSLSVRSHKKPSQRKSRHPPPSRPSINHSVTSESSTFIESQEGEKCARGEKCKGDFCALGLIKLPNIDLLKRFPVKTEIIALGKLMEYSPIRRPEVTIPPTDLIFRLESDFRSLNSTSLLHFQPYQTPAPTVKKAAPVHSYFELLREEKLYEDIRKIGEKTYSELVHRNRKQIFYLPSASVCFSNLSMYPLKITSFASEAPESVSKPSFTTLSFKQEKPGLNSGLMGKKTVSGEVPVCFRCYVVYMNISRLHEKDVNRCST